MSNSCLNRCAVVALLFLAGMLSACIPTTRSFGTSEALVLEDGSEIPCEILEFDDEYVYFEPATAQDRFKYGDYLALGEVKFIKIFGNNTVELLSVDDYIEQKTEIVEDASEALPSESTVNTEAQTGVLEKEFSKFSQPKAIAQTAQVSQAEPQGPGMRLSRVLSDSVLKKNRDSGVGLRLPNELATTSDSKMAEAAYRDIAELIVASGAAGLVFYRAEQLKKQGVDLPEASIELLDHLSSSEQWQQRVDGLRAATRVAREDFSNKYDEVRKSLTDKLGFRPQSGQDDFVAFVLHLHTNGGLRSPRKKQQIAEWFGELAERAFSDILANFDDWYYLVVIQGRR